MQQASEKQKITVNVDCATLGYWEIGDESENYVRPGSKVQEGLQEFANNNFKQSFQHLNPEAPTMLVKNIR